MMLMRSKAIAMWAGFSLALICSSVSRATSIKEMPENAPRPMPVGVSLSILDVQGIKENLNTLYATVEFHQTWRDPRLAFDPIKLGAEEIVHTDTDAKQFLDTHWNPHIVLTNQISTTGTPEVGVEIRPDGTVSVITTVNAGFYIRSDYFDFPFDRQAFPIDIASDRYYRDLLTLSYGSGGKAASVIDRSVHLAQWTLTGLSPERSTRIGWDGTSFEHLTVKILATRNTLQYAPQIFLPYLFIMISPLIVLMLKVDSVVEKTTMLSGAALATIALQFTVAASFPEVVLTDNIVSRMFWLGYAFLLIMLILVITVYNHTIAWFKDPYVIAEIRAQLNWVPAMIFLVLLIGTILAPVLRHMFA
jgi:hypothetical protein